MNKEDRNSFRKDMLGKLEEQWVKSNSPEDDLFYYYLSEDKIVPSHALFWVMTQNIKGKVGKVLVASPPISGRDARSLLDGIRRLQRLAALLQHHVQYSSCNPSKHVRFPYPLRCS